MVPASVEDGVGSGSDWARAGVSDEEGVVVSVVVGGGGITAGSGRAPVRSGCCKYVCSCLDVTTSECNQRETYRRRAVNWNKQ